MRWLPLLIISSRPSCFQSTFAGASHSRSARSPRSLPFHPTMLTSRPMTSYSGSPQLQMLHTFFSRYRHAEALTLKTAFMHGATLTVFFTVVCVIDIMWILSWYSALGTVSKGGKETEMGPGSGSGDRSMQQNEELTAFFNPPRHILVIQGLCSLLGKSYQRRVEERQKECGRRDGRRTGL